MNLFQIKTKPHDIERFEDFVRDNFIAIGWPGIGDLSKADREEIRERLIHTYAYSGQQLGTYLGWINAFVNTMSESEDNLVMISRADYVYIGKVGQYEYHHKYDNPQDGMCHQRPVQWLKVVHKKDLNSEVLEFLRNRGTVTQFKHPFKQADLALVLEDSVPVSETVNSGITINDDILKKAIKILSDALESSDQNIRIQAASSLLQYVKKH